MYNEINNSINIDFGTLKMLPCFVHKYTYYLYVALCVPRRRRYKDTL